MSASTHEAEVKLLNCGSKIDADVLSCAFVDNYCKVVCLKNLLLNTRDASLFIARNLQKKYLIRKVYRLHFADLVSIERVL
jgi:hypothetical protein